VHGRRRDRSTTAGSTSSGSAAESKGLKRGVVVNLEAAVESIKKAIEEAELMAGVEIDSVHLGHVGPHIKGFNSRGVVAVAGKNREITRDDVRRAIDAARRCRCRPAARSSTCCRRTSWWTSRTASARPSA
jgi:cell division protein FtsA